MPPGHLLQRESFWKLLEGRVTTCEGREDFRAQLPDLIPVCDLEQIIVSLPQVLWCIKWGDQHLPCRTVLNISITCQNCVLLTESPISCFHLYGQCLVSLIVIQTGLNWQFPAYSLSLSLLLYQMQYPGSLGAGRSRHHLANGLLGTDPKWTSEDKASLFSKLA